MIGVTPVECVEGCGGSSTLTIIGLIVAGASFLVAVGALLISTKNLGIASREHQEFMRQLGLRADFDLNIYLVHPPGAEEGGVIEVPRARTRLKWQIGIENSGDKAASAVGMNFLVPRALTKLHWTTEFDTPITDDQGRYGPKTTSEELPGSDDSRAPAWYLIDERDRVSKIGSIVRYAAAVVEVPNVGDEVAVPVKFKVWSDDLPDDVGERIVTMETIVRRTA